MSRAPYSLPKNPRAWGPPGNITGWDTTLGWRYPNPKMEALFPLEAMGETAENIYSLSCSGKIEGGQVFHGQLNIAKINVLTRRTLTRESDHFAFAIAPIREDRQHHFADDAAGSHNSNCWSVTHLVISCLCSVQEHVIH